MMERRSVEHFPAEGAQLFIEPPTPNLLWAQVLTYRPLFLLGSLWLALVCASAVAYHYLMVTQPPIAPEPELSNTEVMPAPSTSLADLEENAPAPANDGQLSQLSSLDGVQPLAPAASNLGPAVTLWGLMSLVGLCALGCFVISQQAKSPPRRPQRPKRRLKKRLKQSPMAKPSGPKRLEPYQPQRDSVIVQGGPVLAGVDEPLSYPGAVPAVAVPQSQGSAVKLGSQTPQRDASHPPATRPSSGRGQAQCRPPQATQSPLSQVRLPQTNPPRQAAIVPEEEVHPLDWSEASIAHTLDLRQRHSLSSWL